MSDASEVKRYFIETIIGNSCVVYEEKVDGLDNYTEMVIASDHDRIVAELKAQLKEANEALSWYADEKNWMTTRKDELHEARMTIAQDPDSFGVCSEPGLASTLLLIGGKRAREYVRKWEGES